MKKMIGVIAVVVFLLASCTKEDMQAEQSVALVSQVNEQAPGYATGWEPVQGWNQKDSADYRVYFAEASRPVTPDILQNGAVIIFVRNIRLENGQLLDKPVKLDYAIYPQPGRPAYHSLWYFHPRPSLISYQYRTNKHQFITGADTSPSANAEFRTFIFTPAEIARLGHNRNSIFTLNYDQLRSLMGLQP